MASTYYPKQYYTTAPKVVVPLPDKEYNIYFREKTKKLACIKVGDVFDHKDAIGNVQDMLYKDDKVFFNKKAVLALIHGGVQ